MAGIYGNQLVFFSELFRYYDYFKMSPKPVASYTKRESLGKVKGVFQYMKRGELVREHETLADVDIPTFWTRNTLTNGNFIEVEGEVLRIVNKTSWKFEGNFNIYILETVVGDTDTQTQHEDFNYGRYD